MNSTTFSSLAFSINVAGYYKQINKMKFTIGSIPSAFNPVSITTLTYNPALNVVVQCNPLLNLKYDSLTDKCVFITSCSAATNALYCVDEDKALVCKNTFNYGII